MKRCVFAFDDTLWSGLSAKTVMDEMPVRWDLKHAGVAGVEGRAGGGVRRRAGLGTRVVREGG